MIFFMFEKDIRITAPRTISPSFQFNLNNEYSGTPLFAGDLTGDGKLDFVSARNQEQNITAISAYNFEGKMLWTWGIAGAGNAIVMYDLPIQIYDINADGKNEVIFCAEKSLIILEGASGKEIARYPLPDGLDIIDCITFGNLLGHKEKVFPPEIIIKSRYTQLWAYTADWKLLWTFKPRFGWKTCHHPTLIDIDGDGMDEVFAGFEMVDHDGKILWSIKSFYLMWRQFRGRGHLDCVRVLQRGSQPEEWRIVLTYCGSQFIGVVDGNGNVIWSKKTYHFESIDVGNFSRDYPTPQLFVDIDHKGFGEALSHYYDPNGQLIGEIKLDYGRQHRCVDWTGDGLDNVVIASPFAILDGKGNKIASLDFIGPDSKNNGYVDTEEYREKMYVSILDITGKKNGDIVLHSKDSVCIYYNEHGKPNPNQRWDTVNLTYY